MKPFPVDAQFEVKDAGGRLAWAAFHAPMAARELGLLPGFLEGEPEACETIAKSLNCVVAAVGRTQTLGAPSLGREVALSVARLFAR